MISKADREEKKGNKKMKTRLACLRKKRIHKQDEKKVLQGAKRKKLQM